MSYETIRYEVEDGVCVLTLNRPEMVNAISPKMVAELTDFFMKCENDIDARVIVLRGAGERGFCSGLDLKEVMSGLTGGETDPAKKNVHSWNFQTTLSKMFRMMRTIPQPIIAVVHGAAIGGGLSFSYTSDIRLASDDAYFRAQFINLGVGGADMGSSYFLWRIVGWGKASEMMLTGEKVTAQEALRIGLVNHVYSREALLPAAMEMAKNMATKSRMQLHLTKEALNIAINGTNYDDTIRMEDRNQILLGTLVKLNTDVGKLK